MIERRSREKAMLAAVSRLRRLLRKADLATKRARVIEAAQERFYIAVGWQRSEGRLKKRATRGAHSLT